MTRRKLVLFTNSDPGLDPGPALNAYHFATVATEAGPEAEVRLARAAHAGTLPEPPVYVDAGGGVP